MSKSIVFRRIPIITVTFASFLALILSVGAGQASALATQVNLGTADSFAVLAYSTVTNTGPSIINGDIGLDPGSSVTGFPPGVQASGTTYISNGVSLQARNDATNAFTTASGQVGPAVVGVELGGSTLTPDLYESGGVLQITGNLTLDGEGDPNAVWVFRSTATLITASASQVILTNSANPCNVFWIVPSSATLGTGSTLVGTVIASDSISVTTGASIIGRLFALNGAVTLDTATITSTGCSAVAVPPDDTPPDDTPPADTPPGTTGAGAGTSGLPPTGVEAIPLLVGGLLATTVGMWLTLHRRGRIRT